MSINLFKKSAFRILVVVAVQSQISGKALYCRQRVLVYGVKCEENGEGML